MSWTLKAAAIAAATTALVFSGAANATTVKFTGFAATTSANPKVQGQADMQYDPNHDTTKVSVELHNLAPNSPYVIFADSDGPGTLANVVTQHDGNVSFHAEFTGDATTQNPAVLVFAGTLDTFTIGDLRAEAVTIQQSQTKFTGFDAVNTALTRVDGNANMQYEIQKGTTHVNTDVHHLQPDTAYVIYAASDSNGVLANVVSSHGGDIHFQGDIVGDATVAFPMIYVFSGTIDTMTSADLQVQAFPD